MMVLPPGEPMIINPLGVSTKVGDMLDRLRLLGAIELAVFPMSPKTLGLPGLVEKSSISLLSSTPVPAGM